MPDRLHTRLTQHHLAAHLGVAQKTVSRVFTDPHLVSEAVRSKVLRAARELGYRPNTGARAMRTGRFESVVLVQSTERTASPMPERLIIGIDEELSQANISLVLARLPDDRLTSEDFVPKIARELLADGMLVNYDTNIPERLVDLIEQHQLPAVWINSRRADASVRPDDMRAGDEATAALIERGHRRILYVDFFVDHWRWVHYSRKDRRAGYRVAMSRAGLSHLEATPDEPLAEAAAFARAMLKLHQPTAVVAYGDNEASHVIVAALRAGLDVPRELSVVTFAAEPYICGMKVATWVVPQVEMGRIAARRLLSLMHQQKSDSGPVVLPLEAHFGVTLLPPPATA